jgi:regulator of RNase E activity RraA
MQLENELAFLETLFTPLVSDTMDSLGIEGQVLPHSIQSIFFDPHLKVAGYAFPCRVIPTQEYVEINKLLEMVDAIPNDSFVVVASDDDTDAALWGGLMSTRAQIRGAKAAVVNGGVRDIEQIHSLSFPVFGEYRCIKDIRHRGYMAEYGVSVMINETPIHNGDIVFGDMNGVLIIPGSRKDEVFERLRERLSGEVLTAQGLKAGKAATELFASHKTF